MVQIRGRGLVISAFLLGSEPMTVSTLPSLALLSSISIAFRCVVRVGTRELCKSLVGPSFVRPVDNDGR